MSFFEDYPHFLYLPFGDRHSVLLKAGDALNRLTGAEYSTGEQFEYQYSAVGNATVVVEHLTTTVTTTYTLRQAQGGPTTPPTN